MPLFMKKRTVRSLALSPRNSSTPFILPLLPFPLRSRLLAERSAEKKNEERPSNTRFRPSRLSTPPHLRAFTSGRCYVKRAFDFSLPGLSCPLPLFSLFSFFFWKGQLRKGARDWLKAAVRGGFATPARELLALLCGPRQLPPLSTIFLASSLLIKRPATVTAHKERTHQVSGDTANLRGRRRREVLLPKAALAHTREGSLKTRCSPAQHPPPRR